ncbi:MAG: transposase [Deltaproteobacteria bacterium]|nr:transposase [Deltaproteobacteria bacterium]
MTVKLAHTRLCHFCHAFSRETLEMVMEAHNRAFAFFGGACGRGIYDNMSTAVSQVLRGKHRELNPRFEELCAHYLVEPTMCTPTAGWEKGQVENLVGVTRKCILAERRKFASIAELNEWLLERTVGWAKTHKHPEFADKTIWEVFKAERGVLIRAPKEFDGYRLKQCRVSSTCLVHVEQPLQRAVRCGREALPGQDLRGSMSGEILLRVDPERAKGGVTTPSRSAQLPGAVQISPV